MLNRYFFRSYLLVKLLNVKVHGKSRTIGDLIGVKMVTSTLKPTAKPIKVVSVLLVILATPFKF